MKHLGPFISTHLFEECSLRFIVKANQLLHHHYLACLPVGHLHTKEQKSSWARSWGKYYKGPPSLNFNIYLNAAISWTLCVLHISWYENRKDDGLQNYLDGLSKASLPKHLSVDEVGRSEDTVCPTRDNSERLRSIDLLLLGDGWCCVARAWWLVDAVTPPERQRGVKMTSCGVKYPINLWCCFHGTFLTWWCEISGCLCQGWEAGWLAVRGWAPLTAGWTGVHPPALQPLRCLPPASGREGRVRWWAAAACSSPGSAGRSGDEEQVCESWLN